MNFLKQLFSNDFMTPVCSVKFSFSIGRWQTTVISFYLVIYLFIYLYSIMVIEIQENFKHVSKMALKLYYENGTII
jgi:hypothetical protein